MKYDVSTYSLADILDDRMDYPARQILILRNLDTFLDEPSVMARLKKFAEHMAGSKFGQKVYETAKKVKDTAKKAVRTVWEGAKSVGRKLGAGLKRLFS